MAALSVVAAAAAAPSPYSPNHVIHERREVAPRTWHKRSTLGSRMKLPMRIGLKQSNLDKGHDLLMEVLV